MEGVFQYTTLAYHGNSASVPGGVSFAVGFLGNMPRRQACQAKTHWERHTTA